MRGLATPFVRCARVAVLATLGASLLSFASAATLLESNFANVAESHSQWKPLKGSNQWLFESGTVLPSGAEIFDTLRTSAFKPIENGAFDLSVRVRFESAYADGNNRFFLQMRDSRNGGKGYELVISQNTNNNTIIAAVGAGAPVTLSSGIKGKAQAFPTSDFVTVRWVRSASGQMQVFVDGREYITCTDDRYKTFDTLTLGSRAYVPAGESGPSAMRHAFSDVVLKTE